MNWRSSTPPDVVADVDSLTEDSVEAAATFLSSEAAFTPFMLTMGLSGTREIRNLGSPLPNPSEEAIAGALELPADMSDLRARACVLDVVAHDPFTGDAIKVKIEHRSGFCSDLLVPYTLSLESVEIDMASAHAEYASPLLWGRAGDAGDDMDLDL